MAPLDPLAKLEMTYVCICLSGFCLQVLKTPHMWVTDVFLQLKYLIVTFVVADSQGNNGRPGKPGDRGAPGPQVYFLQNKDAETQKDTNELIK